MSDNLNQQVQYLNVNPENRERKAKGGRPFISGGHPVLHHMIYGREIRNQEQTKDIDKNAQYIEVEFGDKRDPKVEMGEFDGKVVAIRVKNDEEISGTDIEAYCQAYYKDVMRESGYYDVIAVTPLTEEEVKDNYDYYKISEVNNMPLLTNELAQKLIQDKNNDEV